MSEKCRQGYYCVIHYIDNWLTLECVCVGVAIFEGNQVVVKVSANTDRVYKFFGKKAADHVGLFLPCVARGIVNNSRTFAEFNAYRERMANSFRITEPRSMSLEFSLEEEIIQMAKDAKVELTAL